MAETLRGGESRRTQDPGMVAERARQGERKCSSRRNWFRPRQQWTVNIKINERMGEMKDNQKVMICILGMVVVGSGEILHTQSLALLELGDSFW